MVQHLNGEDMNVEIILNIFLTSFLGVSHVFVIVTSLVWRLRRFHKGLHYSAIGLGYLFLSIYVGMFLPIGGFTFLDGGASGTKALIAAAIICPFLLFFAIRGFCYCIYIDGCEVVKRTLFREVRIDLRDKSVIIDDSEPWTITFWISIRSDKNQITFNSRRTEGDIRSFVKNCKIIHKSQ